VAIVKPSGSIGDIPVEIQENEKIANVEVGLAEAANILPKQPEIYNVFHNATALSEKKDAAILNTLAGFLAGAPIRVVWYNQITSRADNNSNMTSVSFMSDSVNTSYLKIIDMELRLSEQLALSYDTDGNASVLTSVGITYPGFIPKIGDMFIYRLRGGYIGLFKLTDTPERLSIATGTAHKVSFTLLKLLETEEYAALEERVRATAYFNKKRFLTEPGALLTHQEMVDLQYIRKQLTVLMNHYGNKFYNSANDSIFRPDGVYDPYMVDFLHRTCGTYLNTRYVVQLYTNHTDYNWDRCILAKLISRDNLTDTIKTTRNITIECSVYSSIITALLNRQVVLLDVAGTDTYLSTGILSLDSGDYTDFDRLVTLLLVHGVISYEILKGLADDIRNQADMTQFYQIPVIIYLLKLLSGAIESGVDVKYVAERIEPYIEQVFTAADAPDNVLETDLNGSTVVGIVTNTGQVLYPNNGDIVTVSDVTLINLDLVMAENSIDTIEGNWKLVLTNNLIT
jgi:hypothetical protein